MNIGFDGKRAVQNFTGLGNYSRFVLDLLARYYPENEYLVYTPSRPGKLKDLAGKFRFVHPPRLAFKWVWRSWGMKRTFRKNRLDLFHGLSNELPFGISRTGTASVVTVHDLIFLRFPEFYPLFDRKIYALKFRYACRNATRIIAVSEQTKRDIVEFLGIPADKIDVVYQGCNPLFRQEVPEADKQQVRRQYQLPGKYLLQVGTIEERKNLLITVKALKSIDPEYRLVVIGKETDYAREVREYIAAENLTTRVIFLQRVPLADLPAIYQMAGIFVYPSEFEGFGIPVLEALCSGVPVVAATGSSLEEAGGPGSCYVHPKDEVQLAWNVNQLIADPERRAEMIREGYRYTQHFSDENLAARLVEVYQKTIEDVKR
jgi:glycosyltransferase involved in cell wall biosynthesis